MIHVVYEDSYIESDGGSFLLEEGDIFEMSASGMTLCKDAQVFADGQTHTLNKGDGILILEDEEIVERFQENINKLRPLFVKIKRMADVEEAVSRAMQDSKAGPLVNALAAGSPEVFEAANYDAMDVMDDLIMELSQIKGMEPIVKKVKAVAPRIGLIHRGVKSLATKAAGVWDKVKGALLGRRSKKGRKITGAYEEGSSDEIGEVSAAATERRMPATAEGGMPSGWKAAFINVKDLATSRDPAIKKAYKLLRDKNLIKSE